MKPYKGKIEKWYRIPCEHGLGYMIGGRLCDHEGYRGGEGHTSYVVEHNETTGEIETKNSRYTLIGEEIA